MATFGVAIVGGGCSGALVAVQLLRQGYAGSLCVIEPRAQLGRGLAYSTEFDEHLLNVPAANMSGLAGEPSHFLDWLRAGKYPGAAPDCFAPRKLYGKYLGELLSPDLPHIRAEVLAVERDGGAYRLALGTGAAL